MPVNQLAEKYLSTYRDGGGDFPDGLPFAKALGQANLDYSRESLERIDRLLDQIRIQAKPEYEAYVNAQSTQNFLYLLCFYFGTVVARLSGQPIDWYEYEEMRSLRGDATGFPDCFTMSMTCVLGGKALFMPLVTIEDRLFDPAPTRSLAKSADEFAGKFKLPLIVRNRQPLAIDPANSNIVMDTTAELLGSTAAWSVYMIAGGATLIPLIASGNKTMRNLAYDDLNMAVDAGLHELKTNPNGVSELAFVYDGFISLDTGRTDALIAEARHYRMVPGETNCIFRLSIALPYRHANNEGGFMMHTPRLIDCDADKAKWPSIFEAFYRGVDQFTQPQVVWPKTYGDES